MTKGVVDNQEMDNVDNVSNDLDLEMTPQCLPSVTHHFLPQMGRWPSASKPAAAAAYRPGRRKSRNQHSIEEWNDYCQLLDAIYNKVIRREASSHFQKK